MTVGAGSGSIQGEPVVQSIPALLDALATCRLRAAGKRVLIALAGPPGSGKSTLAAELFHTLEAQEPGGAAIVPMDGFHLDDSLLVPAGLRAVKGAPETFDLGGFRTLLQRLRGPESPVFVPVFDRNRELAMNAAARIDQEQKTILVEGNYLLLDAPGWRSLAGLFDLRVFLDVPEPVLEQRLVQRWLDQGLSRPEALSRAEGNDIPNGRRVLAERGPADMVFSALSGSA